MTTTSGAGACLNRSGRGTSAEQKLLRSCSELRTNIKTRSTGLVTSGEERFFLATKHAPLVRVCAFFCRKSCSSALLASPECMGGVPGGERPCTSPRGRAQMCSGTANLRCLGVCASNFRFYFEVCPPPRLLHTGFCLAKFVRIIAATSSPSTNVIGMPFGRH